MADRDMVTVSTGDGWMLVRLDTGATVSLPEYCHVRLHKTEGGRDAFTIAEGPHAGKAASLKSGNLKERRHEAAASLQFYLRSNVFTWQGGPAVRPTPGGGVTGGLASFTDPSNKVPPGVWDVEIPDFPHDLGRGYTAFAAHAMSWFRVAAPNSTDRYLHPGTVSLGCVTVGIAKDRVSAAGQAALRDYERIYAHLIARRKSPGVVGRIQVFDY